MGVPTPLPFCCARSVTGVSKPLAANSASRPDKCTALKLVPLLTTPTTEEASSVRVGMSDPGAVTHMGARLEYEASSPWMVDAATGITPAQLPGK